MGQGSLIIENHYHTQVHHTRYDSSGRVIGPSQRPLPDNTQHSQQTSKPLAGSEPALPASERPHSHALERAGTGIDRYYTQHH